MKRSTCTFTRFDLDQWAYLIAQDWISIGDFVQVLKGDTVEIDEDMVDLNNWATRAQMVDDVIIFSTVSGIGSREMPGVHVIALKVENGKTNINKRLPKTEEDRFLFIRDYLDMLQWAYTEHGYEPEFA